MNTFDKIIDAFMENNNLISEAITSDAMGFKFDMNKVNEILKEYSKIENSKSEPTYILKFARGITSSKMIITNGNPYTTLILCAEAIISNVNIFIDVQNQLTNLNYTIINICESCLKSGKQLMYSKLTLKDLTNFVFPAVSSHEILVVDDKAKFNELALIKMPCRYLPIMSVEIYYDSEEFENMIDTIEYYCEVNYIKTKTLKNISIEKMQMQLSKKEAANAILILTKDENKYKDLKERYYKNFYINYNPFDVMEIDLAKIKHFQIINK